MNLKGSKQYSQASSPMRGGSHSLDIQHKLIFIYPMLFDEKTSADKEVLRDFISLTFLREIFTSNFLNLVSMTDQISPITDEQGNQLDIANYLGKALMGRRGGGGNYQYNFVNTNKQELQQVLNQKFKILEQYLRSDPVFKKLKPKSQIITLKNLIDVPVIVGTTPLDVNTSALMYLLMFAIANNKPLDTYQNIHSLIETIKRTKKEKLWKVLKQQANPSIKKRLSEWLKNSPRINSKWKSFKSGVQKIPYSSNFFNTNTDIDEEQDKIESLIDIKDFAYDVLDSTLDDLDNLDLYFKFFLDKGMLERRYGIKTSHKLSKTIKRLSPEAEKIFAKLNDNFLSSLSTPTTKILLSVSNLILPLNVPDLKFSEIYDNYITNGLSSKIENFIDTTLTPAVINHFKNLNINQLKDDDNNIKIVKELCKNAKTEVKQLRSFVDKIKSVEILFSVKNGGPDVNRDIANFLTTMNSISTQMQNLNNKSYNKLYRIVDNFQDIRNEFEEIIDIHIRNFIQEYVQNTRDDEVIKTVEGLADFNTTELKKDVIIWVRTILEYLFLTSLTVAICEYIKIVDVEIETTRNEVTDFPNYTLVIPVEVILSLHAAYNAGNLNKFIKGDYTNSQIKYINLTNNYIKGIIKYLTVKLKIPNLIVIDNNKSDIYYRLMNMSDINKTKINTIKTFNNLNLKSQEYGIQY